MEYRNMNVWEQVQRSPRVVIVCAVVAAAAGFGAAWRQSADRVAAARGVLEIGQVWNPVNGQSQLVEDPSSLIEAMRSESVLAPVAQACVPPVTTEALQTMVKTHWLATGNLVEVVAQASDRDHAARLVTAVMDQVMRRHEARMDTMSRLQNDYDARLQRQLDSLGAASGKEGSRVSEPSLVLATAINRQTYDQVSRALMTFRIQRALQRSTWVVVPSRGGPSRWLIVAASRAILAGLLGAGAGVLLVMRRRTDA